VATIGLDSSGARNGARPSISLHPAFPAIVATWFAALLGAGSMVLPAALLERAVEATGIAALIPPAAPPLGFTARALIALAAAGAGALAGAAIARRVTRAHGGGEPGQADVASGARRPISVNEELGGDGFVNGCGSPVDQHRAIAIAEDERSSDLLFMAPLTDSGKADATLACEDGVSDRPRADELRDPGADRAPAHGGAPGAPPGSTNSARNESEPIASSPEPLQFSAPSRNRRAPADEPDLAQLVRRLGASIARRRDALAGTASAAAAPGLATAAFDPAPAAEAVPAMAAYFGGPAGHVAALPPGDAAPVADAEPTPMPRDARNTSTVVPLHGAGGARPFDPPAAQDATDAALRAALETLRRMNGAA